MNRLAVNEFHYEVRKTVFGGAAVDEPRDVGMVEGCEDFTLAAETIEDLLAVYSGSDQLDGHTLVKRAIVPFPNINRAHTSAADLLDELIAAELPALQIGRASCRERGEVWDGDVEW